MKSFEEIKTDLSIRWYGFTYNLKKGWYSTVTWCENNKELAIVLIPAGFAAINGVSKTIRTIDRKNDLKKEQELKEEYIWDASMGKHHHLKHKLTVAETIELDHRRRNGESMVQILDDMRLIIR